MAQADLLIDKQWQEVNLYYFNYKIQIVNFLFILTAY